MLNKINKLINQLINLIINSNDPCNKLKFNT